MPCSCHASLEQAQPYAPGVLSVSVTRGIFSHSRQQGPVCVSHSRQKGSTSKEEPIGHWDVCLDNVAVGPTRKSINLTNRDNQTIKRRGETTRRFWAQAASKTAARFVDREAMWTRRIHARHNTTRTTNCCGQSTPHAFPAACIV